MTQENLPHRKIANEIIHAEGAIAYNDTKILGLGDSTCDSEQRFHVIPTTITSLPLEPQYGHLGDVSRHPHNHHVIPAHHHVIPA